MARTRDWRRKQRKLHRGREKYTDWWHAYNRSDTYFMWGMHRGRIFSERWRVKNTRNREDADRCPNTRTR